MWKGCLLCLLCEWNHFDFFLPLAPFFSQSVIASYQGWFSIIIYLFIHGGGGLVTKSCQTLSTPWTVGCGAPLSMGFSRQEYWSGLPFPPLGDLPDPGIKPRSPALQTDSLLTELQGKLLKWVNTTIKKVSMDIHQPELTTSYTHSL